MARLNIKICALSEMRLAGMGNMNETDYTILLHEKEDNKVWQQGVGLAIQNSLMAYINAPSSTSEHIMTLQLNTVSGPISIMCLCSQSDDLR